MASSWSATPRAVIAGARFGPRFDHVLVLEPSTIADRGPAGLRQLYVALTRSTQTLTVLHTTPLPRELGTADEDDDTSVSPASPPVKSGLASATGAAGTPDGAAPQAAKELPIGTPVKVRVAGPGPGAHWKVKALAPATARTLLLVTRHGEPAPKAGVRLDTWVTRNEGPVSLVAAGDFGRKPISARMAPRYLGALGALQDIVEGGGTVPPGTTDRLSELRAWPTGACAATGSTGSAYGVCWALRSATGSAPWRTSPSALVRRSPGNSRPAHGPGGRPGIRPLGWSPGSGPSGAVPAVRRRATPRNGHHT